MSLDLTGIATGYLSVDYGQSFRPAGRIISLPQSGLQLIQREITPSMTDLAGLYPYAMCRDFAALAGAVDRAALRATGAVSLSFVADPFEADTARTTCTGWALCRPYKTHFVIDLMRDWRAERTKHTRYYVRQGYKVQQAETVPGNRDHAALFWRFYRFVIDRHQITGIQRMSESILAEQMEVPGAILTLTRVEGKVTGAMLSYVHDSHVNAHLVCFDPDHYRNHTSYVLIDAAAAHAETLGCRWFNLGGSAGPKDDPDDGLYQFKRRWTEETRETTLCGQVLDRTAYDRLCAEAGCGPDEAFFPAYRRPGLRYEWRPMLQPCGDGGGGLGDEPDQAADVSHVL